MAHLHTRRDAIRLGLGGVIGASALAHVGGCQSRHAMIEGPQGRTRVARLVHMTDTHIQPEKAAFEGVSACLRHISALDDRPELIITGGDLVMDSYGAKAQRTQTQWDLYTKVFRDDCPVRVEHCLGNHDIWGWHKKDSATTGQEAQWGKRWALDVLELERPYRAFDLGGTGPGSWRCLVLDSVQPHPADPNGYIGQLDPEQRAWLEGELAAAANRHVVVVSHIPILSLSALAYDADIKGHDWVLPGSEMMIDGKSIIKLFAAKKNVRLCLSGHIHKLDRCEYEGTTYICDGAVCGAWWNGPKDRVAEGYGLVDLYSDGTIEHRYVTYGWQAKV